MVLLISRFNAFSGKLDFARYMIRAFHTLEGRRNLENTGIFRVAGIFTNGSYRWMHKKKKQPHEREPCGHRRARISAKKEKKWQK